MPAVSPATVAALRDSFAAFLAALESHEGGRKVYDALAADAPVYAQLEIKPKRDLGREDFFYLHGAGYRMHEREHPGQPRRPAFDDLVAREAASEGEADERVVAWYGATDRHDGRALDLAVGWVREGEAWKIGWLTLAEGVQPWTWAMGRLQTMADFVYGEVLTMVAPRSWLDVAWHRLYGRPEPAVLTLPDERFSCQMTTRCCRIGFKVDVPPQTQHVLDAIPWAEAGHPELAGVQLPARSNGRLLLKDKGETCRYLDDNGHCLVHKAAGRAIFPICATFPFQFRPTPDGVVVTTSHTCGSARANVGVPLAEQTREVWSRLAILPQSEVPTEFRLGVGVTAPWALFKEAERTLLDLIARRDLPMARRLWMCERYLFNRVASLPFDAEAEAAREIPQAPEAERTHWREFLHTYVSRFGVTIPEPRPALFIEPDIPQEELLARTLRALIFDKGYSFSQDLTTGLHVAIFQFGLFAYMQGCFEDRRLPDGLWWWLAGAFQHEPVYLTLAQSQEETKFLLATLGDPGFGLRLIGAFDPAPAGKAVEGAGAP